MENKEILSELMNRAKMKPSELANKMDCTAAYVSHLLSGHRKIGRGTAQKLSRIFNVSLEVWNRDIPVDIDMELEITQLVNVLRPYGPKGVRYIRKLAPIILQEGLENAYTASEDRQAS